VFEAAGSIPDEEKQIIRERVLNPFIDYYLESYGDDRKLLSITVKPNYNSVWDILIVLVMCIPTECTEEHP
jgi:hypothetical protein